MRPLLSIVLLIGLLTLVYFQFSISFGSLGIVLFALCYFVRWGYDYGKTLRETSPHLTGDATMRAALSSIVLVVFGCMCVYTLNNYLYPDARIFTNADHHTIRIEGLQVRNAKGFMLAGNSKKALFDGRANTGDVRIKDVGDSTVTLTLSGKFQRALYAEKYSGVGHLDTLKLVNEEHLVCFDYDHPLYLRTKGGRELRFEVRYDAETDSMHYYLNGIPSNNHSKIKRGNNLTSLLSGLHIDSLNIDVEGLHIVRPYALMDCKHKDYVKYYGKQGFAVEIQNRNTPIDENSVVAISSDGQTWRNISQGGVETTIEIEKSTSSRYRFYSIGYDTEKTASVRFEGSNDTLGIKYRMPMMRYMSSSDEGRDNLVLLTHSLNLSKTGIDESYSMLPDNIMLFDIFDHIDNDNRIKPKQLSYTTSDTKTRFYVDVYDYNSGSAKPEPLCDNAYVEDAGALNNSKVQWLVQLYDTKANSRYKPWIMKSSILGLSFALSILILIGSVRLNTPERCQRPLYSTAEFVLYMVTLFLVTLRWFLLWRVSVFPPVNNVSWFEYNGMFQKASNMTNFIYVLIAFVAVIVAVKVWLMKRESYEEADESEPEPLSFLWRKPEGWLLTAGIVISFGGLFTPWTWVKILMPIVLYCLFTILNHTVNSKPYYTDSVNSNLEQTQRSLILDIINALVWAAALMMTDPGYGILFFTFSLIWTLWELYDFLRNGGRGIHFAQNHWGKIALCILAVLMIVLIGFFKEFIAWITIGNWTTAEGTWGKIAAYIVSPALGVHALLSVLVSAVAIIVMIVIWGKEGLMRHWRHALITAGSTFVLTYVCAFGFKLALDVTSPHTAQRINVHVKEVSQSLNEIEDNDNQRRYINAAMNHIILGEYNDRGSEVHLFWNDGVGYFKMQPHSKTGAMWGAQLSDISLVRFLIAEHSQILGLMLVALFVLMLLVGLRVPKHHRFARYILIQIPLLLSIQSLLIWMANTQKFIFLGQDFPMVSINSTLAIAFYFSLVLIWLSVVLYEKRTEWRMSDRQFFKYQRDSIAETVFFAVLMPVMLLAAALAPRHHFSEFDATEAMTKVHTALNGDKSSPLKGDVKATLPDSLSVSEPAQYLNDLLLAYQSGKDSTCLKSMTNANLQAFIKQFNDSIHAEDCFAGTPLGLNLWRNYVDHGAMRNNARNVMYARLNKKGKVVMCLNSRYYNQSLPKGSDNNWHGSVLAHSDMPADSVMKSMSVDGARVHVLPAKWMRSGTPTLLVSGNTRIEGKGHMLTLAPGTMKSAAQLLPDMTIGGNSNACQHTYYIARNIIINGSRNFVYPLGERFFYARSISDEIRERKRKMTDNDKNSAEYNHDIRLSFSARLTSKIYDVMRNGEKPETQDKAVVVADGDGKIVAMVNYKRNYRLNPNDDRRISRIADSLYIYGHLGSGDERSYFGNSNLMGLRYGPGSTQKPLVWTAVASGIDYDWKSLEIASYEGLVPYAKVEKEESSKFDISHFNGYPFLPNKHFRPLCKPDENEGKGVTLQQYMSQSSNVYNALMVYIGSWPRAAYTPQFVSVADTVDRNTLFAQVSPGYKRSKEAYAQEFPVLKSAKGRIRLNAHPIGETERWLDASLLQQNMYEEFGVMYETIYEEMRNQNKIIRSSRGADAPYMLTAYDSVRSFVAHRIRGDYSGGYSYCEPSLLMSDKRSEPSEPRTRRNEFMEHAVRWTAVGGGGAWSITPVQMAQSYGRMASLNQNYRLTILDDDPVPEYSMMGGLSKGYMDARSSQMQGMNEIFVGHGTASKFTLVENGKIDKKWYAYAKTGTIGPDKGADNHRFGLIITNMPLDDPKSDLSKLRYYVLYFSYANKACMQDYMDVATEVTRSREFLEYMEKTIKL